MLSLCWQMKKLTVAILSVYYLAIASGITVNFHFCMEELASVSIYGGETKKCARCGMTMHKANSCCRDEIETVKLQDDHQKATVVDFELASIEPVVTVPSEFIISPFQNVIEERHFHNHSPPLISAQDTYLQINVFRI
jgi:hypothetical protein